MAKSKIIRDLANGDGDVVKALKRLKVLMSGIGDTKLTSWINNELTGYTNKSEVPDYRKTEGRLYGTYIVGNRYDYVQYENCPLPISEENESIKGKILTVYVTDSISSVQNIVKTKTPFGSPFPPEYYPILMHGTNIANIVSAVTRVSDTFPQDIIAKVESILIDVLCSLERKFGVLDSLDIDFPEDSTEKDNIIQQLTQFIYIDSSISIGDNNRLKDSDITSG